ncbi:hypothetical protein K0A97_03300 [Patescibacteria group bacterium]|nr:hypothetical protein [Patescibacteria group bacterium]
MVAIQDVYRNKNQKKTSKLKRVVGGILGLGALIGTTYSCTDGIAKKIYSGNLRDQDFQNSEWILYNNPSGTIWHGYMNENIERSVHNWGIYAEKVREKNDNKLEGLILLPDLDKDNQVGREK